MNIKYKIRRRRVSTNGFALPMVLIVMIILIVLTVGTMMVSYGSRIQAVKVKAETEAMLAAEAGYERAIFWMSQQTDILGALQAGEGSGNINFATSRCNYDVQFQDYMGARPVFKILSTGISGRPTFTRVVEVAVMQETSGWAMGACKVPYTATTNGAVNFKASEIIDMPLHINRADDSPDIKDIFIDMSGSPDPRFLRKIEMGEPRKTSGGTDKYTNPDNVMPCFEDGIYFDQPNVRITNANAVQSKVDRFRDSTATSPISYRFTPADPCSGVSNPRCSAVQLEFYVTGEVGYVRITNNCTVRLCVTRSSDDRTWDYNTPGIGTNPFKRYNIYAYHYRPTGGTQLVVPVEDTYVTQEFGGYTSEPGGQIYVNGNVVIGSDTYTDMVVKGRITVVASGNIWVADSIKVDDNGGAQRDADGKPSADNPNVLGLIAQGIIKVIDPGISNYGSSSSQGYPVAPGTITGLTYQPVGNGTTGSNIRTLPHSTVIEAAITVGGGGWGAENVARGSYGGRKEFVSGTMDNLVVRGSITEVVRGVVGMPASNDGYNKYYYIDARLMSGILPGDIWFSGKYIPAPAGWHDRSIRD
jgi:type II secretory pathway pseudopilin PulG